MKSSCSSDTVLPESPDVYIVYDTHLDERFAENPLVIGPPFIRFYAGAALIINDVKVCKEDTTRWKTGTARKIRAKDNQRMNKSIL